jgi:hypothetical protein
MADFLTLYRLYVASSSFGSVVSIFLRTKSNEKTKKLKEKIREFE